LLPDRHLDALLEFQGVLDAAPGGLKVLSQHGTNAFCYNHVNELVF
jgi:hypothetical protein